MLKDKRTGLLLTIITLSVLAALVLSVLLYRSMPVIAYVDNNKVLSEFKGFVEGKKRYEEKVSKMKANLDTMEMEVNANIEEYKNNFPILSEKEKVISQTNIKRLQQNYFNYKESLEKTSSEEDQKITADVLNQVNSYLLEYGEANKYDFILGVNDMGSLLYGKKNHNITDEVIKGLNQKYEGK